MTHGLVLAALALSGWSTPQVLSSGAIALEPELSVAPSGAAMAVWDHESGPDCAQSPASLTCAHIVEFSERASTLGWSNPREIARPGIGARPTVALNDGGRAAVLWVHDIGRDRVVQATYRVGAADPFPNPSDLSAAVLEVRSHHIGLDAAGNAAAVWAQWQEGGWDVAAELRSVASGTWGAPVLLSTGPVQAGPSLAVTPGGDAFAVWIQGSAVLAAHADLATGSWDPPVTLSRNAGAGARVAVNAHGDAVAVWTLGDRPGIEAAEYPAGESWSTTTLVADVSPYNGATAPAVALSQNGTAVAAWVGGSSLRASVRASDGNWSRPVEVGAADATEPRVATDSRGDAIVTWLHRARLLTSLRPAVAAAWQPPEQLSGPAASAPQVALDAAGNGVVLWNLADNGLLPVLTASLPAAWAPTLANTGRPSIRGVVRAGHTVTCMRGGWAGTVPISYAYTWLRNGRAHGRASTYAVKRGDVGARLACRVSASNPAGVRAATSAAVRVRR
jgi:hypothetical protein